MRTINRLLLLDYQSAEINKLDDGVKPIQIVKKSIIYIQNIQQGRDVARKVRKNYSNVLLSIGSYLKKRGIDVRYLSLPDESLSLKEMIIWADAIFCWCTTPVFPFFKDIICQVKRIKQSLITILGGYHASGIPIKTLNEIPQLDFVTIGESEKALMNLCDGLAAKQIKGIAYRDGAITKVNRNNELLDGNEIAAPDYSLLNGDKTKYRYYLQTMYSCPFHCKYCVYSYFWGEVRFRSDDSIREELQQLKTIKGSSFDMHLLDTIVNYSAPNVKRLISILRELNLSISFSADIRPEFINKDSLKDLELMGVKQLFIGFEDANQVIRGKSGRFMSNDSFIKALYTIKDNTTIVSNCYWMLGMPGTTKQSLTENKEFVSQLLKERLVDSLCPDTIFVPLPGTPFYNQASKYGIYDLAKDWLLYRRSNYIPVYRLDSITKEDFVNGILDFDRTVIKEQLNVLGMDKEEVVNRYLSESNMQNVEKFLLL